MPWEPLYDVLLVYDQETEESSQLMDIIQQQNWTTPPIGRVRLTDRMEFSIADALDQTSYIIILITEKDCFERSSESKSDSNTTNVMFESFDEEDLTVPYSLSNATGNLRIIPIISCEFECFSRSFPELAKQSTAHIKDANLDERLLKSIGIFTGKSNIHKEITYNQGKLGMFSDFLQFGDLNGIV